MFPFRTFVADGGLMSYGTSITTTGRPASMRVSSDCRLCSTKFELVITLRPRGLGLTFPWSDFLVDEDSKSFAALLSPSGSPLRVISTGRRNTLS